MNKETLETLYAELGSVSAVARHLGRNVGTMRYHFVKYGIPIHSGYKSPKAIRRYAEAHHNWKGGTFIANRYVWEYSPEHPNNSKGYVKQHRLVMERHLGRYLSRTEDVHHINGDKTDNRLENLIVMTRSRHISEHKSVADRDDKGRFVR